MLTNAAGGINPAFGPGTLMVIADHLNLTGRTPLLGPNADELGPRFPDLTDAWAPALRERLHAAAEAEGVALEEGIYAGLLGPQYETPAEVRMLRSLGADAVGMSTVLECIAARWAGLGSAASPSSRTPGPATPASRLPTRRSWRPAPRPGPAWPRPSTVPCRTWRADRSGCQQLTTSASASIAGWFTLVAPSAKHRVAAAG